MKGYSVAMFGMKLEVWVAVMIVFYRIIVVVLA